MKSTRQGVSEKPLLEIGGIAMVDRVLAAMKYSRMFNRLILLVSPNVPATREHLSRYRVEIYDSAGGGFSKDLARFLRVCQPEPVLVVPADLPLLDQDLMRTIVVRLASEQASRATAANSIVCNLDFVKQLGITPSVTVTEKQDGLETLYCHSGITLFDTRLLPNNENSEIQESYAIINDAGLAINVNTLDELQKAEKLLVQRSENLAKDGSL